MVPVPCVRGISELQRKGKKALEPIFGGKKDAVIFLADRNELFAVVMSIEEYRKLTEDRKREESLAWSRAQGSSLSFWNHPSNDIYDTLL